MLRRLLGRRKTAKAKKRSLYDVGGDVKLWTSERDFSNDDWADAARLYSALVPADDSIAASLAKLKSRSRLEAARGGYLRSAVLAFKREVVGRGLRLRSLHEDDETRAKVEKAWNHWAAHEADVSGRQSLRDLLHTAVASLVVDGEILIREVVGSDSYALELMDTTALDADQSHPPKEDVHAVMGVAMDRWRRPVGYWIRDQVPVTAGQPHKSRLHSAKEVIHVYVQDAPQQTRGVPWAFATLRRFAELREYDEAERKAAKLSAMFFAAYTPPQDMSAAVDPDKKDEDEDDRVLESGSVFECDPGGTMNYHTPTHPTNAYPDYIRANLMAAAAAMGVSYATMTGDLTQANFVSSRIGRLTERGTVEMIRDLIVERVLLPVFRHWLAIAKLKGDVPDVDLDELEQVEFVGSSFQHVQPREAAVADHQQLEDGLVSRSELIRASGRDPRDVLAEIAKERAQFGGEPESKPEGEGDDANKQV